MKINSIRDFLAVAEHGSLRSAARHLGLAQPAMTRSIQELERELGATLFERRAKGVQLTTMGDVLLRRARSVRSELARAKEEIDQLKGAVHGHIRMCLSGVAHMALLADSLPAFRQRFPAVKLEVVDAVLPRVQLELIGGTMDLYIGPVPEKPTSELRRDLVQQFPAPEVKTDSTGELKRLWSLAKRLSAELHSNRKVPGAVRERADALAQDLEELLTSKAEA